MMKALLKSLLPAAFFLTILVGNAHAVLNYNTAYMVTADNSYTLSLDSSNNYSYALNETPWVYLKLKLSDLNVNAPLHILWSWSSFADPSINKINLDTFSLLGLLGDKDLWSSPPPVWWSSNGGAGKWTIDVAWLNAQGALGTSTATFMVTPEPISSALFLFGGVPLAAALLRKKKLV